MKKYSIILLLLLLTITSNAQTPKREFRATWLTTVWGIDWPSTQVPAATGSNDAARQVAIQAQKNELNLILDSLQKARMNAVFFQVRGFCDAYYASSYEPWGQYLSGTRGAYPGYDPLAYAIEQAHARGLELHAWLNPYRYSSSSDNYGNLSTDYSRTHPGWLMNYGGSTVILNPGLPEVRSHIKAIIGDIINHYDVDGIVFDDYFYAYGGTSSTLDSAAQRLYKPSTMSLGDWRRWNINRMIEGVYDTIQQVKPYVTFGVSPFGTWTTDEQVAADRGIILPAGVGQTGNMYAEIYCDPLAWLEEGTVDYVSPQLYWTTTSNYPYGKLAPWWANLSNKYGRHFFSSHSVSSLSGAPQLNKIESAESASTLEQELTTMQRAGNATQFAASEIGLQVTINRDGDINDGPGSVFYNTNKTIKTNKFVNYLRNNVFTQPALVPELYWKAAPELPMVSNMILNGSQLSWEGSDTLAKYAVYAIPTAHRNDSDIFLNSNYLLGVTYTCNYTLPAWVNSGTHSIAVSPVDRYNHEYTPRFLNENLAAASNTQLVYPLNNSNVLLPCYFRWNATNGASKYIWQLSKDSSFDSITASRECSDTMFLSTVQTNIENNETYYWRVKSVVPNSINNWSTARVFQSALFSIVIPENGATDVSLNPTLTWQNAGDGAIYVIQISKNVKFADNQIEYQDTLTQTSCTLPTNKLESYTTYYARVIVTYSGFTTISTTTMFTTEEVVIGIPTIVTPTDQTSLSGDSIMLVWEEQVSNGFTAELSQTISFPPRGTTVYSQEAGTYYAVFRNLTTGTYYLRVKAKTKDATTEPSEIVTVYLTSEVGTIPTMNNMSSDYYLVQNKEGIFLYTSYKNNEIIDIALINEIGIIFDNIMQLNLNDSPINLNRANLVAGNYYILITSGGEYKTTLKFTITQ